MMTMSTDMTYADWVRTNRAHVRTVIRMGAKKAALHEATCDICKLGNSTIKISLINTNGNCWARQDTAPARRGQP